MILDITVVERAFIDGYQEKHTPFIDFNIMERIIVVNKITLKGNRKDSDLKVEGAFLKIDLDKKEPEIPVIYVIQVVEVNNDVFYTHNRHENIKVYKVSMIGMVVNLHKAFYNYEVFEGYY